MPDEQSNLNLPAAARRPGGRRRGRRGGRGRSPRPAAGKARRRRRRNFPRAGNGRKTTAAATVTQTCGTRSRHLRRFPRTASRRTRRSRAAGRTVACARPNQPRNRQRKFREPAANRERRPRERPARTRDRRPEPPRPKPWVKPADFRPAETSAISQAVAHATEIAESLKHTIDQLDEILELVELAERQKLADEREIDELRRALRRIQPPRHQHAGLTRPAPRRTASRPSGTCATPRAASRRTSSATRSRRVRRKRKNRLRRQIENLSAP